MKTQTRPTVFQPTADKPAYWIVDHRMTVLIFGEQTNNAYAVLEALILPGGDPPPYIHHREDEMFDVLDGDITILAGEQTVYASAGTCVHIPAGTVHTFRNEGGGPVRMVIMCASAGFETYLSKAGTPTAHGDETAPSVMQETLARLRAYAAQFNLEIVQLENCVRAAPPRHELGICALVVHLTWQAWHLARPDREATTALCAET